MDGLSARVARCDRAYTLMKSALAARLAIFPVCTIRAVAWRDDRSEADAWQTPAILAFTVEEATPACGG